MAKGKVITVNGAKQMLKTVKTHMKEGMAETAEFWHETFLKEHFKEGAARKYNYQRRSLNHVRRKRKRFGHNKPLVFSGNMKRLVMQSSQVRATKKKATLIMAGPRYLFQFRKDFNQPNKALEITEVTRREVQRMNIFLGDFLNKEIKKNKIRKVKTV